MWRIWSIDRRGAAIGLSTGSTSRSHRMSSLQRIMRIIIDSALLYTISVIIFVITYVAGSNANYGTSDNVSTEPSSSSIAGCYLYFINGTDTHPWESLCMNFFSGGTNNRNIIQPHHRSRRFRKVLWIRNIPTDTYHHQWLVAAVEGRARETRRRRTEFDFSIIYYPTTRHSNHVGQQFGEGYVGHSLSETRGSSY